MHRKIFLAAALVAAAAPAFADTAVKVNLAGMDAKAAHAAIQRAATVACRIELANESSLVRFYNNPTCVQDTVAAAETKYAAMRGLASR
jgi:hypothetical protein